MILRATINLHDQAENELAPWDTHCVLVRVCVIGAAWLRMHIAQSGRIGCVPIIIRLNSQRGNPNVNNFS